MRHLVASLARTAVTVLALLVVAPTDSGTDARQGGTPAPEATIDVVALDREGRFVDGLRPGDFAVTIDGVRRPVLWVRRVSRGPGAMTEAASRASGVDAGVGYAAEQARTVLVVVDQSSILRGDERGIVQAAGLFLDRLGLNDRVAIVTLPVARGALVNLTSERAEVRAALARVSGRLAPAPVQARAEPVSTDTPEQVRMSGLKPEGSIRVDPTTLAEATPGGADARESADTLAALRSLFETLREVPGRKVVAAFSGGLPTTPASQVDEAARAAASGRTVVVGLGVHSSAGGGAFTTAPLERLAAATGGMFAPLGRNPARAIDEVAGQLGACYVLGLTAAAGEPDARPRRLRVETTRKGVTLRTGAWLPAAPDADQVVEIAAAPTPAAPSPTDAATAPTAIGPRDEPRPPGRKARDDELLVALARLFDYADGYERQYSMLVAEEDYRQSASAGGVRLRSDIVLVRPGEGGDWVSFRDVFEVDGTPVRDREERLRRLFLDGSPDARARLEAIGGESARYNVGWVERTANVPLLPLSFLRAANRGRFEYELAGRDKAAGFEALRIRYTERARPTLIGDRASRDVPVSGTFLVDAATGAVIETRMNARSGEARAEIVVRYRPEPALGLWVPAEMKESYSQPDSGATGRSGLIRRAVVEGRATYSNFRRFQVTTGEAIAPPK